MHRCPEVFVAMQAFEDAENLRLIFRAEFRCRCLPPKKPTFRAAPSSARHRYARGLFRTVLQGIADKVLEMHLRQVQRIGRHHRQRTKQTFGAGFPDAELCRLVIASPTTLSSGGTGSRVRIAHFAGARIFQQSFHQRVHSLGARHRHIKELSGLFIQRLSRIPAADELQIVGDRSQRFFQIVRNAA